MLQCKAVDAKHAHVPCATADIDFEYAHGLERAVPRCKAKKEAATQNRFFRGRCMRSRAGIQHSKHGCLKQGYNSKTNFPLEYHGISHVGSSAWRLCSHGVKHNVME
jgi:hypothetical protein